MKFTVKEESSLLEFLYTCYPQQSRTGVKNYLKNDMVVVNGQDCKAHDWPLRKGDTVEVINKGQSRGKQLKVKATEKVKDLGLTIVYEDAHLIVVDKPSGLPTIATKTKGDTGRNTGIFGGRERTAYSILMDYCHSQVKAFHLSTGEYAPRGTGRVWIVHRLDRDTSGLLLFAKDERTKDILQSKWSEMVIERKYFAILEGRPQESEGVIESYLVENPKSLKMTSLPRESHDSQRAVTRFRCTDFSGRYTRAEFELETGRKNQIRVHAAQELGCPVAGDRKYGAQYNPVGRLALHAGTLIFRNPYLDGPEILKFESPVPANWAKLR